MKQPNSYIIHDIAFNREVKIIRYKKTRHKKQIGTQTTSAKVAAYFFFFPPFLPFFLPPVSRRNISLKSSKSMDMSTKNSIIFLFSDVRAGFRISAPPLPILLKRRLIFVRPLFVSRRQSRKRSSPSAAAGS